ncbi:hypothetical protein E4K72_02445 [Oxalobacteraceae bacterium OM1]|nr:hypothetical protein E4K72_02445 [Oxalobacteraceae bacterium OM1]
MKALIKDLSRAETLAAKEMSAVRGGFCGMPKMPVCSYPSWEVKSSQPSTVTTTVDIAQANNQFQSNATGNCSAVFGGSIYANNNQQGYNSIG